MSHNVFLEPHVLRKPKELDVRTKNPRKPYSHPITSISDRDKGWGWGWGLRGWVGVGFEGGGGGDAVLLPSFPNRPFDTKSCVEFNKRLRIRNCHMSHVDYKKCPCRISLLCPCHVAI